MKINTPIRIFIALAFVCGAFLSNYPIQAQGEGFSETFDDPSIPEWEHSPSAQVVDGILHIDTGGYAMLGGEWSNLNLSVLASVTGEGFAVISYHVTDSGDYAVHISGREVILYKAGEIVDLETIEPIPPGEWFSVNIYIAGDSHEIYLNGQPVLVVFDQDPLPPGGIALSVFGEATGKFDDLTLVALEGEPPPEEPAPAEPTPTEETPPAQESGEPPPETSLTWVRTGGPPGGIGYDIRYKFDNPTTLYVTDNFAGVHMSTDNGLTWLPSNEGISGQLGPTGDWRPIFSLTVDPHNPQVIWAGTDKTGRIYKSEDGGKSWTQKDSGVIKENSVYNALTFRGFTVDPGNSNTVYAMGEIGDSEAGGSLVWGNAVGGVVYKTIDGGENWELIWGGDIPSSLARYMWINPQNTDILYVSTGIFDRGAINEGDPNIDTDPFGGLGILKSIDGGKTWQILNEANGLNFLYISSLFMHPDNPNVLLAATGKGEPDLYLDYLKETNQKTKMGVYRTANGGETWKQVLDVGGFNAVEMCPSDPDIVYAGSASSVYRSEDAGLTWTQVAGQGGNGWGPPGILAGVPIDFQCDPNNTNRLFTNNYLGGNFLSEDGGKTWKNASDGYTGAQIISVAVDPNNPATIYVAGRNGIWASSNGGSSWYGLRYVEPGVKVWGGEWGGIVIDPTDSQHLLVSEETIWETFNGGSRWEVRQSPAFALAGTIVFAPSDPNIVYTGRAEPICLVNAEAPCQEGNGVYVSRDGGKTWEFANDANIENQPLIDLAVDPASAQVVYAATQTGLFKTIDGGVNWTLSEGLPNGARVGAITVHPQDSQKLMAGVESHGLYTSADGGQTWQQIAAGLQPNNSIRDILYDPFDSEVIYLSDLMSGVYRSTDGGQTWAQINNGLTTRSTTGLSISSDGQHLYVATNGEGVFRLDLNDQPPVAGPGAGIEPEDGKSGSTAEPAVPAEESQPMPPILLGVITLFVVLVVVIVIFVQRRRH